MRAELSPWARGALTPEERLRIRAHDARGIRLSVIGAPRSPMFTVAMDRGDGVLPSFRTVVHRERLFVTIRQLLAAVGEPMSSDEEWADTMERIRV